MHRGSQLRVMASFASSLPFGPDVEKSGNFVRDAWDRMHKLPGGKRLFSLLVGRAAPYTGSIGARIEALEVGYARVTLEDRPRVRNHLRCVHAIALANLAEVTGNVAVFYALPDDMRFIVAGLSIDYLKKARGKLTAESRPPAIPSTREKSEIEVVVEIRDAAGDVCARSTLRTLVGPKKA